MRPFAFGFAALLLGRIALACEADAVGVDTCRKIEKVRCESAPACGIDLGQPVHRGDTPTLAVAACIRYYDDECLHGLVGPQDPGSERAQACVDAIIDGGCEIVKTPEKSPACSFLIPPPEPAASSATDAGDGGAAADAATGG